MQTGRAAAGHQGDTPGRSSTVTKSSLVFARLSDSLAPPPCPGSIRGLSAQDYARSKGKLAKKFLLHVVGCAPAGLGIGLGGLRAAAEASEAHGADT